MFINLKRIIVSIATVQAAFLGYRLLAVPLIEPAVDQHEDVIEHPIEPTSSANPLQVYAAFFPPGSWELNDPIVLESDNSKLLMQKYQNLDDNRVRLDPCTVIFAPDGSLDADPATHRVIVLQAPQGAELKFDQPVDIQKGKIGRLLSGEFPGPITIRGTPSRPGADDNLQINTHDVHMTTDRIWNSAPVQFRFGAHSGSGRDLVIHLLPAPSNKAQSSFSMGGLESFELLHDVQMRMVPGRGGIMPMDTKRQGGPTAQRSENPAAHRSTPNANDSAAGMPATNPLVAIPQRRPGLPAPIPLAAADDSTPATGELIATTGAQTQAAAPPPKQALPEPPVDIHCVGPFRFDMVHNMATFEDQVDVVRVFINGTTDHMNADWLAVHFAPKQAPTAAAGSANAAPKPDNNAAPTDATRQEAGKSDGAGKKMPGLEPSRLEARGKPVIIQAPSNSAYIRCEHLDYNLLTSQVTVEDSNEATIQQTTNEIHCKFVVYQPGEAGQLGQLLANGPGWLRGTPPAAQDGNGPTHERPATPPQLFEAHWTVALKMRPYEGRHVISLLGGARAGFSGQGELSADEIHLWLIEPPAATTLPQPTANAATANQHSPASKSQPQPDRMLAQGHVHINSPQMVGNASRLEAWFEQAPTAPQLSSAFGAGQLVSSSRSLAASDPLNPLASAGAFGGRPNGLHPGAPNPTPSQYQVDGERIRVQFLVRPEATEVQNLSVDNQVRLVEIHTANPGDQPLIVTGDALEVLRANALDTDVTVHGRPGQVGARGLEMFGETIRLNKGSNRVWIDGPGRMKLPANQGMGGTDLLGMARPPAGSAPGAKGPVPQAPADPMFVTWQGRMDFDGQTAHFEHTIVGQNSTRNLRTENLDVMLRQKVNFAQVHPQDQTAVGRILCHGKTLMENRTVENEKLTGIDKMQVRDLLVDEVTGLVEGQGPGWVSSVRHGDSNLMGSGGIQAKASKNGPESNAANTAANSIASTTPGAHTAAPESGHSHLGASGHGTHHTHPSHTNSIAKQDHLNYLNVQFAGPLTGNLNQHEITMHDQVHTIYGPVLSWNDQLNPDNIDELEDGDELINCDQLTIRQGEGFITTPQPAAQPGVAQQPPPAPHHPMELEANGNTLVEAKNFTARASRMTYAEAKDLLVLEGDGRRDAELYRQDQPGAPESSTVARRILFWRSTNRVSVNDARYFNLDQPNDPADTKKGTKPGRKPAPGVASPPNSSLVPR